MDLDTNGWYHAYTDYVIAHGLMQGMDKTHFAPQRLHHPRPAGDHAVPPGRRTGGNGEDLLHRRGRPSLLCQGCGLGGSPGHCPRHDRHHLCPRGKVTREQAATFLYRYVTEYLKQEATEGADLKDYLDGHKVMDYAQTAFGWAVAEGALRGLWGWHAPSRHHPDPGSDGQASNHPGSEFLSFV